MFEQLVFSSITIMKHSIFWYQGTYLRGGKAYICFSPFINVLLEGKCQWSHSHFFFLVLFTPLAENAYREILRMGFFDDSFYFYLLLWLWQAVSRRQKFKKMKPERNVIASCSEFRRWRVFWLAFSGPWLKEELSPGYSAKGK